MGAHYWMHVEREMTPSFQPERYIHTVVPARRLIGRQPQGCQSTSRASKQATQNFTTSTSARQFMKPSIYCDASSANRCTIGAPDVTDGPNSSAVYQDHGYGHKRMQGLAPRRNTDPGKGTVEPSFDGQALIPAWARLTVHLGRWWQLRVDRILT